MTGRSAARRALPVITGVAVAAGVFAALPAGGGDATAPRPAAARASAPEGRVLFARMGCGSCHRLAAAGSTAQLGPDLDERLAGHTPRSLAAVIADPPPSMMPADFEKRMTPRELDALARWLVTTRR